MISISTRRLQFPSNIANALQLALFLACIFCSTNSAGSSNVAESAVGTATAPSPMNTPWLVGLMFLATVIVLLIFYWGKYTKVSGEKKSWDGFLIFFFAENWVTFLLTVILVGAAHYSIGGVLGHEAEGVILAVAIINPLEHLFRRLLALPKTIEKTVMEAVPKSLDAKKFFVTGTSHSKDVKAMLKFIHDHSKFDNSANGISIFRFQSSADEYAKICQHFLASAEQIESMTDMDLDKALPLFKEENGSVMSWVMDVNKRKTDNPTTKVHRVLVLTEERRKFLGAIETLIELPNDSESKIIVENYSRLPVRKSSEAQAKITQYIEHAKAGLINFKKHYCTPQNVAITFNILAKGSQEIGGGYEYTNDVNNSFHDESPRGEFIMFDRKYLVRFNSEAKLLEVFIGEMVAEFSKVFSPEQPKHLLSIATDNSFSKLNLPVEPWESQSPSK